MKKLLVFIAVLFFGAHLSYASSFKLDAAALESKFASASEISISAIDMNTLVIQVKEKEGVSRVTAGVLGIFCGGLGIHRFYMGHKDAGIVYLIVGIVSGTSISAIAGLVDGIMYLASSDEEFVAKYLHNEKIIQWL